ncbi:cysteine desulfurase NifS [Aristaeella hokkaidonensis]|uniref:Cysteine desulfurase NifS n=1 Tax=Aristaeella hokkaidonensis TaxID=3046382 RepID=A0AC61MY46_9FIRM|nr:cysteine desulfurase NifS [Aristaeella hokkaidonensis]QUC67881.1 cysteine desulfurase NifS [Aristaeella hokkaidonensis]SNT92947.1 cysteine desulfurase [Aristaeella hokkaidonensis]
MMNRIYLDHAATTPVSAQVLEAMIPFFSDCWGNASSVYGTGREARKAVEKARRQVAEAIGAEPREILFTGCGSESDNLAVKGTAFALKEKGRHIITTDIEHPAVLNTCRWLEKHGFEVSYITPDKEGYIAPEKILAAIREDTILISMMAANNEIGTIEPVAEVGAAAREKGICFHTDAVQAAGAVPINVNEWKADLLSISAHKFYGPKGAGALYVRHGTHIDSLIHGGEQERGLRAGTENVPGIVGLGTAIEAANKELKQNADKMTRLRERLINSILSEIPGTKLNGPREGRLPNNCNISFDKIDGEALLLRLDLAGIAASSGSACTAGSQEISHVLKAIGLTDQEAKGSLRLTTGTGNTEAEIDEAVTVIHEIVNDLRSLFRG